jgi:hypothetical protein
MKQTGKHKKKTPCIGRFAYFSQSRLHCDNTESMPEEVLFGIAGSCGRPAFPERLIPSSGRDSIATLVSTLP